jgi:hypothetical protein
MLDVSQLRQKLTALLSQQDRERQTSACWSCSPTHIRATCRATQHSVTEASAAHGRQGGRGGEKDSAKPVSL